MSDVEPDLTTQVRRGVGWAGVSVAATFVLQLGYTAYTARALDPREFGIYAGAQALISVVTFLALGDVGSAVARHGNVDSRGIGRAGAALAVQSAFFAAFLILVGAPAWADLWNVPDAVDIMRLGALHAFINPLMGVVFGLARRGLRFREAAVAEIVGTAAGFVVGAISVAVTRSAAGLVIGQATGLAVGALVLVARVWRLGDGAGARVSRRGLRVYTFKIGTQIFFNYGVRNGPQFVIARLIGATAVGFFSRMSLMVQLPVAYAVQTLGRVTSSVWPRVDDEATGARALTDGFVVASGASLVAFGSLFGASHVVVDLILGSQYLSWVPLLRLLCLGAAATVPMGILMAFLESRAEFRLIRTAQAGRLLALSGLVLLIWSPSLFLAGAVMAGAEVVAVAILLVGLGSKGQLEIMRAVRALIANLAAGAAIAMPWFALAACDIPVAVAFIVGVMIELAIFFGVGCWRGPQHPTVVVLNRRGVRTDWRPGRGEAR